MKTFLIHLKKPQLRMVFILLLLLVAVSVIAGCSRKEEAVTLRLGWQISWTTQGQIAQVLRHTDILDMNEVKGELHSFSYGGPLNEGALAGEVDVIFTADQPAVSLISRGAKWKIIARLVGFRAAIIVPSESDIETVSDLKGKTLAAPFGSSTHRIVLGMLKDAGLDPEKDLKVINLDILEQAAVVQSGTKTSWGEIDAFASWDPHVAIFESKGLARMLSRETGLSVVVMSEDFVTKHRNVAKDFLKSYIEAYYFYATHQPQANDWFAKEARLTFDPSLLDVAASYEPNMKATSVHDIDVNLTEEMIKSIQAGADFAYGLELINVLPEMSQSVDLSLLRQAQEELRETAFDIEDVRVTTP